MTTPSSFAETSRRLRTFIEGGSGLAEADFSALAHELFTLQFTHVAPYRHLCEARRMTPNLVTDWRHIPAVPAAAFKELDLTSLTASERTGVFHSSGTTVHRPSRHFHSAESLAVYETSLLSWFKRHVLPDARDCKSPARFLCLAPPAAQAPHSSLVHMFAAVSRAFGAPDSSFVASVGADNSWLLDSAAALGSLRHAEQSNQPLVLLGTAFMFVHLLDTLAQHDLSITLPPDSRVMETGGYKGRSRELPKTELHTLITSRLGIPPTAIVCEYGMSELSSQAYSLFTLHSSLPFRFPPWARALVTSPETGREAADGETGLLRIFDLANVRSVMAIQTEDLAVRRGDGFELLGRATQAEARGCSLLAT